MSLMTTFTNPKTPQQQDQCTKQNLRIRRNWRAFSPRQKKEFINSVLCLQHLPARTPANLTPGAKTRYDDFVVTHINQTMKIHYTVLPTRSQLQPAQMLTMTREHS